MNYINFYRGLKESYNGTTHNNGIFFATDSKEIIMNGVVYTGSLAELIETVSGLQTALDSKVNVEEGKSLIADDKIALIDTNADQIASIQQELESLSGGAGSIQTQINNAIGELDANIISAEGGNVRVQVIETDGKITAVNITESDIASAAALQAVKDDVDTFFKDADLTENAKDTLKEIQDYIDSDATAAAEMTQSIADAKSAADNAQKEVDALETEVAGVKSTAESASSTAQANATAIAAMTLNEVTGYIKSVSQENGKVTATAVANIPAADVTVADAAGYFEKSNVEEVLAEIADMLTWKEL